MSSLKHIVKKIIQKFPQKKKKDTLSALAEWLASTNNFLQLKGGKN